MSPRISSLARPEHGLVVFPGSENPIQDPLCSPLHLAIGMFDGVHIGHQVVIRQAVRAAADVSGDRAAVLTFDPHPSRVLHPERATDLIMPLQHRVARMLQLGLDRVFVQTFTPDYAGIPAGEFVPGLKRIFPGLRSLHVGENFRFGSGRRGTAGMIRESAARLGLQAFITEREHYGVAPVSSSRIREDLASGLIDQVNAMLGQPYTVSGPVIPGRKIGRTLGFPTLNIPWQPEAMPRFGVYMAWLLPGGGAGPRAAVANYGLRPTVGSEKEPLLEVHLLEGGSTPSPGEEIEVALTAFIRPEQAFPSVDALREQISRDVARARELKEEAGIPGPPAS